MCVHITKTYNIGGLMGVSQNALQKAAMELGFKELSLFKFADEYDNDEELNVRIDGIISALCPDDIVIFQYPSGISIRYDRVLVEHIRCYAGTRIIMMVQDGELDNEEIELVNQADLCIFPSKEVHENFIKKGLKDLPVIYQETCDYMIDMNMREHKGRNLFILTKEVDNAVIDSNVELLPFDEYHVPETIMKLSEGGIGLVWDFDELNVDTRSMSQALALYIVAGIPVIVQKGSLCESFVEKHNLGMVANNLDELYKLCADISDEKFEQLYSSVRKQQRLFIEGIYSKKLLLEAIVQVNTSKNGHM